MTVCCRLKLFLEKYIRKIQDAKNTANLEVSHLYRKNPTLLVEKVIFYKLVLFETR